MPKSNGLSLVRHLNPQDIHTYLSTTFGIISKIHTIVPSQNDNCIRPHCHLVAQPTLHKISSKSSMTRPIWVIDPALKHTETKHYLIGGGNKVHENNGARVNVTVLAVQLLLTWTWHSSCSGGRHNMPPPLQVDNIFVFIRQVAGCSGMLTILRHQQQVDLLTLKVVSELCVTWATYFYANLGLPRHLCSRRLRPDVRADDVRQTSDAHHRLMPLSY